ncbi:glycosyltransferase [Cellulomonas sp. URHB0016]
MRVLHVVECYEAGVGRAVDTLARATPEIEHHLLFAGSQRPRSGDWASAVRMADGLRRRVRQVADRVDAVGPDVVHAHSSWAGVYVRARRVGTPVVYQPHGFGFVAPALRAPERAARWGVEAALARRTGVVAVVSESEADAARTLGGRVRVARLPNAPLVDVRDESEPRTPARQVATIGRITAQKRPDLFREVARRCAHLGAQFVWIGDGDRRGRQDLEDAGVRVTGWLDGRLVQGELDRTAVYLHTADYEGFPVSVLDAAARRVPLALRDIPAFASSGLPVVPEARLAAQVGTLLDDEAAARSTVDAGRRLVERMNRGAVAGCARAVYASVPQGVVRARVRTRWA